MNTYKIRKVIEILPENKNKNKHKNIPLIKAFNLYIEYMFVVIPWSKLKIASPIAPYSPPPPLFSP